MTTASGQTIGLVMIVKNEAEVMKRCLDSVRGLVDTWTIVDTGSSDDTKRVVEREMSGVHGRLHDRPWVDFGHNRTELLELARGQSDYMLTIDADEVLLTPPGYSLPTLTADGYMTLHDSGGSNTFYLMQLMRSSVPWRYDGVVHEHAACDVQHSVERLGGIVCKGMFDSARNKDAAKFVKDAILLENDLRKNPGNPRNTFYLAQSYRDSGQTEKAIDTYRKRSVMGGWAEEVWYSMYQVGLLLEKLGKAAESVTAHLRAFQFRPTRAEPLCELARRYRLAGEYNVAHMFAARAARVARPDDILFLDSSVYDWRVQDELAISSFYTGRYAESMIAYDFLLSSGLTPDRELQRIAANMKFSEDAIQKSVLPALPKPKSRPKPRARSK